MAPGLARHLRRAKKAGYDRRLLRDFQVKAGLVPDRLYGGATRGALLYYGGKDAPAPFSRNRQGTFETLPYTPPA